MLYTAIALTTLATLLLELSLTRIFAVLFYYPFAFLAISIALLGLGVGGVLSYVIAAWPGPLFRKLGLVSLLTAGLVLAAAMFLLTRGAAVGAFDTGLICFTAALPFLGSGIIVSLVFSETIDRIDKIYFFDLLGAAGGCLLLVILLNALGGPDTVIAVSVMFCGAAGIWFTLAGFKWGRMASVFLALFLTVAIMANTKYHVFEVRYADGQKLRAGDFTKWNGISRIGMAREPAGETIFIDGDASTAIANFDFNRLTPADLDRLLHEGPGIPYNLRPGAESLIVGPGGGWDVARALASGSRDVTGVEVNRVIATTIMRQKFPQLSRNLYLRPDVHIFVEDGRSFLRASHAKYQVIQATLLDAQASAAAGAFALSGNDLYTADAFRDYLSHLTGDGLLTFTRWGFDPPRESLRLIALAISALNDLGEHDAARHVLAARKGAKDTVIISRHALSDADIAAARAAFQAARMTPLYLPGDGKANEFGQLLLAPDPFEYERNYKFDITPVDDNRPFFFYTAQPWDMNVAVCRLFSALTVSVVAVTMILLLPPVVLRARLPREGSVRAFLLYFLAIGAGYILIEAALIRKFILFLGHPVYALTVVIFSLLVSSGLGSLWSRKIVGDSNSRLAVVLAISTCLALLLAAVVQPVMSAAAGLPLPVRVMITIMLIAPAGFTMGMPFPSGLRFLARRHAPCVRWAWALNAAASVMGSVGALVLAIYLGLVGTMLIGGALYLCALAVILLSPVVREPVMRQVPAAVSV